MFGQIRIQCKLYAATLLFSSAECFYDSVPVPETVFTTTINKPLNDGIFCGRMWENIPLVQLYRSTIYAKARLSSSGGS